MQRFVYILFVSLMCLLAPHTTVATHGASQTPQAGEPAFPFPKIPLSLQEPAARFDYLLRHYWENFDFKNPAQLDDPRISEQGFVNFVALITDGPANEEQTQAAIRAFCTRMSQSAHGRSVFIPMAKEYLYHTQSPMYNEGLYALFLREMLKTENLDDANRQRMSFRLKLVESNSPGKKATDFTYFTPDGQRQTLMHTAVKGNHMMLFFYDPECSQCHQTLTGMAADPQLKKAVETGELTLLAIYTEDAREVWKKALSEIPDKWIAGDNRSQIKEQTLYDLKAMPSLYLLDREKKVVLKDATIEEIKNHLFH